MEGVNSSSQNIPNSQSGPDLSLDIHDEVVFNPSQNVAGDYLDTSVG